MKLSLIMFSVLAGVTFAGCSKQDEASQTPPAQPPPAPAVSLTATDSKKAGGSPPSPGAPVQPKEDIPAAERLEPGTPAYDVLMQAIQSFSISNERPPANLDELVKARFLRAIPKAPEGKKFVYDPNTQSISIVSQ